MRLEALSEKAIVITFIAFLLASAYIFGTIHEKIKGPRVVGEILGGMIISGSCLFPLFPNYANTVFLLIRKRERCSISSISQD